MFYLNSFSLLFGILCYFKHVSCTSRSNASKSYSTDVNLDLSLGLGNDHSHNDVYDPYHGQGIFYDDHFSRFIEPCEADDASGNYQSEEDCLQHPTDHNQYQTPTLNMMRNLSFDRECHRSASPHNAGMPESDDLDLSLGYGRDSAPEHLEGGRESTELSKDQVESSREREKTSKERFGLRNKNGNRSNKMPGKDCPAWKVSLWGLLDDVYASYATEMNYGFNRAKLDVCQVGNVDSSRQLLDTDPSKRRQAALDISYILAHGIFDGKKYQFKQRQRSRGKELLGDKFNPVVKALSKVLNRKYRTAEDIVKDRITEELVDMIKTPGGLEEAVHIMAREHWNSLPPRGRKPGSKNLATRLKEEGVDRQD